MADASHARLRGCFTALITPFTGDGALDHSALDALIEWQITQGIHGLVPCGTTGESPTLTPAEHTEIVARTVKAAGGRVPVMAGTGSNSTAEAIEYTRHAEKAGADAVLVVAPYYNKPTQEGLFQHYQAVARATRLPVIIYNIPGRSIVNLTDETLARLAEIPNIAGVKDATGDLARVTTLRARVGTRLLQFSGEDMTAVGFNAMGGIGVISVLSNVLPQRAAQVQDLCLAGRFHEAQALLQPAVPLIAALFMETNPIPVKYALARMGKCGDSLRLPLVPAGDDTRRALETALQAPGLLG